MGCTWSLEHVAIRSLYFICCILRAAIHTGSSYRTEVFGHLFLYCQYHTLKVSSISSLHPSQSGKPILLPVCLWLFRLFWPVRVSTTTHKSLVRSASEAPPSRSRCCIPTFAAIPCLVGPLYMPCKLDPLLEKHVNHLLLGPIFLNPVSIVCLLFPL